MDYKFLPTLNGVVLDYPQRIIAEDKCAIATNVLFKDAKVQKRWGYQSYGGNLPLSSQITGLQYYQLLSENDKYVVATTTRDTYYYDEASGDWKLITLNYNTGTVAGTSGTKIITLSTGTFDSARWTADSIYKIKFGTTDLNGTGTPDTWYTVKSVDSSSQITLVDNLASTLSGSTYVLRLCWTGSSDNYHSFAMPYDDHESEKILVIANGIDYTQRWTGTGTCTLLGEFTDATCDTTDTDATVTCDSTSRLSEYMSVSGTGIPAGAYIDSIDLNGTDFELSANATATGTNVTLTFDDKPNISKFIGYFGSIGYEHLITAYAYEGTDSYPQTIKLSLAGKTEQWNSSAGDIYYDLLNQNDAIVGIVELGTRLMIYKEHSITEAIPDPSGGNLDPLNFIEDKIARVGTPSIRTVINVGTFHLFFGWDNFYMFDGINVKPIGEAVINDVILNSDRQLLDMSHAFLIEEENLYVFLLASEDYPDKAYVYNYVESTWQVWEFTDKITASGSYKREYSPSWDEMEATAELWTGVSMRWSDLYYFDNNNRYLIGDSAGYIYELSGGFQYDSQDSTDNAITSQLITRDYPINDPKHTFRLLEVVAGVVNQSLDDLGADVTTVLKIRASIDFGHNWSEWVTLTWDGSNADLYEEQIANFVERGRQVRFEIQNVDGSPFILESLNIGYNSVDLGKKK